MVRKKTEVMGGWTHKRSELVGTLGLLRPIVKANADSPYFEMIRFDGERASAFDGKIQVEVTSPWPIKGSVRGAVMYDVLSSVGSDEVTTSLNDKTLKFSLGQCQFSTVLDDAEKPVTEMQLRLQGEPMAETELDTELREAIRLALLSARDEEFLSSSGVWFLFDHTGLTVIGSDGNETFAATTIEFPGDSSFSVAVPASALAFILKTVPETAATTVTFLDNGIDVVCDTGIHITAPAAMIEKAANEQVRTQALDVAYKLIEGGGVKVDLTDEIKEAFKSMRVVEEYKEAGQQGVTELTTGKKSLTVHAARECGVEMHHEFALPKEVEDSTAAVKIGTLCKAISSFGFDRLYLSQRHLVLQRSDTSIYLVAGRVRE